MRNMGATCARGDPGILPDDGPAGRTKRAQKKGRRRQPMGSQQEWSCGAFSQVGGEAAGSRRARRE